MSHRSVVICLLISIALALPLFGQSDIFVTKDGPSTFNAGTDVTYTITVTIGHHLTTPQVWRRKTFSPAAPAARTACRGAP